jgi:NAD(P)H-quinone oxidoreductase subunit 5
MGGSMMLESLDFVSLTTAFFILLTVSILSSLFLLNPKIPLHYVWTHVRILSLPPIVALFALFFTHKSEDFGPWHFDSLSWLLALFVLTIGLIVQRYSVRYLLGDHSYRKYFALLTFTTVAGSVAWLSNDLRWLLACWGITLLGLTLLIRLKKEWKVARCAAVLAGRLFAFSWLILFFAIILLTQTTGHWQLSRILTQNSLAQLGAWERGSINFLLIAAVIIPAAQWPFHRWLLDSVVAPTPISAVMHAGIVNAGGIILTRFAPLFSGSTAQIVLLVLSGLSVLMGTGMMLVQVDYKRQLVGSTIAQMGFMLIQCALGAYWAAIIHAVLHGLFKATLFLQSGSAIRQHESRKGSALPPSYLWTTTGSILGFLGGIGFWLTSPGGFYQGLSAFIVGWSVAIAWAQLGSFESGRIGRSIGLSLFAGAAIVFLVIHTALYKLIHETVQKGIQPTASIAILILLFILLASSAVSVWLVRNRSLNYFAVIYLWLVRMSEPKNDLVESHPKYLIQSLSQGGHLR